MHIVILGIYFIGSALAIGSVLVYMVAVPVKFFKGDYCSSLKNLGILLGGVAGIVLGLSIFYDYTPIWALLPYVLGSFLYSCFNGSGEVTGLSIELLAYAIVIGLAISLLIKTQFFDYVSHYLGILF